MQSVVNIQDKNHQNDTIRDSQNNEKQLSSIDSNTKEHLESQVDKEVQDLENLKQETHEIRQDSKEDSKQDSTMDSKGDSKQNTATKTKKESLFDNNLFKTIFGIGLAVFFGIIAGIISYSYLHAPLKVSTLLGIMAFLVTLWTNKALPMGVVSLLPIILFPSFGILDTKSATANYANPIIFLFLGGFMIAAATEKIGLHRIIAKFFIAKFPKNPKGVISALGVASCLLGTALSNSTVALLLLPVAMSITKDKFLQTRFLLAVAFGASISGITTPIGSPPNLIYLGFLESKNLGGISFTTWIFMMAPLTLLMLYAMIKILSYHTKDHLLDLSSFDSIHMNSDHKRLLGFIIILLLTLLVNSPIRPLYDGLGWNENVILLAFGLIMFIPKIGFLSWDDSRSIPYEIIFLFGAGFCIATAFSQSQLGGVFTDFFTQFNSVPFVVLIIFACCFAVIVTSFLSTTALIAIILPIIDVATQSFLSDTSRILLMLVVTICASFSFMIPISTPPNAIVFAQGGVKAWDMFRFGFLLSIVGIVCVSIFASWYWWSFLH